MLHWLVEAAEPLRAFSRDFLCEVHVRQVQLDELYAVLREGKDGDRSEAEALKRLERSPRGVWTAMDPESTLLLVMAASVGLVPLLRQLLLAPCQLTPAAATGGPDQPDGLGQAMAAAAAGDGGRVDRARVDVARGAAVSCAAVAATPRAVSGG